MPELPEVETTCRGIAPFISNISIEKMIVRKRQLRLPIPAEIETCCQSQQIISVSRRAKYLLLSLSNGATLLIHLGMSGHLRLTKTGQPLKKHDHVEIQFASGISLHYHDPRRFGLWLYLTDNPEQHPLLAQLGPEPLSDAFNTDYLFERSRNKQQAVKSFIMDSKVVVGVGNIYAAESLYIAKIHPTHPSGKLSRLQCDNLVRAIKIILEQAIAVGGTSLKDFYTHDGKPGYFAQNLQVYGRKNKCCFQCRTMLETIVLVGRSTTFCPNCQTLASIDSPTGY